MAQQEIIKFFKIKKIYQPKQIYYSPKEIEVGLKNIGHIICNVSLYRGLKQLNKLGILETNSKSRWRQKYKLNIEVD